MSAWMDPFSRESPVARGLGSDHLISHVPLPVDIFVLDRSGTGAGGFEGGRCDGTWRDTNIIGAVKED